MEVVPTGDGEDDGVIWFRCPQCQGFLPKLSGGDLTESDGDSGSAPDAAPAAPAAEAADTAAMPWDSPADMMAARAREAAAEGGPVDLSAADPEELAVEDLDDDVEAEGSGEAPAEAAGEPLQEYAQLLAETDPETGRPYRPWDVYEVGQCVHHLAWNDCGVVVAKEELPGGRKVIKVYFEEAGVIRLIEQAPR